MGTRARTPLPRRAGNGVTRLGEPKGLGARDRTMSPLPCAGSSLTVGREVPVHGNQQSCGPAAWGWPAIPQPGTLAPCSTTPEGGKVGGGTPGAPQLGSGLSAHPQVAGVCVSSSACQHQPLPSDPALGWSRCPSRGTAPRLTPRWRPACCWHRPAQPLVLARHPGRGRRGSARAGPGAETRSPHVQPSPPSPPWGTQLGQTGRGTWDWCAGSRPRGRVEVCPLTLATLVPCTCAGGSYPGLGTPRSVGKGQRLSLRPPKPRCPPRSSRHRGEGVMGRTRRARRVTHAAMRSHTPALELPCVFWGHRWQRQAGAQGPARGLCPPSPSLSPASHPRG